MKADQEKLCKELLEIINKHHALVDNNPYESFIVFAIHDNDQEFVMRALLHNVNVAMMLAALKNLGESISERLKELPEDDDVIH